MEKSRNNRWNSTLWLNPAFKDQMINNQHLTKLIIKFIIQLHNSWMISSSAHQCQKPSSLQLISRWICKSVNKYQMANPLTLTKKKWWINTLFIDNTRECINIQSKIQIINKITEIQFLIIEDNNWTN